MLVRMYLISRINQFGHPEPVKNMVFLMLDISTLNNFEVVIRNAKCAGDKGGNSG